MNPTIDILRGELERHYSLEELTSLSASLLGLDPKAVGGEGAKATFARALAESCFASDRVEALVDVMAFAKKSVDPRVFEAMQGLGKEHLEPGREIGDFEVKRLLGESEFAFVAQAQKDGKAYTLRVLKRAVAADRRAVHRFLTANRLVAAIGAAEGLPEDLVAGEVGDVAYVAYGHVEGESLAAKVLRTGPQHFAQAHGLFRKIVEPVAALHGAHLVHGDLRLDHVLVGVGGQVTLIDFGGDKLRSARFGLTRAFAPEVIRDVRGAKTEGTRADVYALGCMLYELLTGKPVFEGTSLADIVAGHLSKAPEAPSTKAPRGFLSADIDAFVLELLAKEPAARPKDAAAVLEGLEALVAGRMAATGQALSAEKVTELVDALLAAPTDSDAALALENAVTQGGDPAAIADAFAAAAEKVEGDDEAARSDHKKGLLYRAGRIYAGRGKNKEKAEAIYAAIVELDPTDDVAANSLEEIKKQLGKFDEVVEILLERSGIAAPGEDRARIMAEVGRLFAHELDDADQALVAYTQALCEAPHIGKYADEIEKLAGTKADAWQETLGSITEAVKNPEIASADRVALLGVAGRFYEQKLGRADMALMAYQGVLASEPSNEIAAEAMTAIYRRAQQWPELHTVLTQRADVAGASPKGRDLRVEAAEILEGKLNDAAKAKATYQTVLAEDPGHEKAGEALARIAEKTGDFETLVAILERRLENVSGAAKADALVRVAEAYEDSLNNLNEATRRFEAALAIDPKHPSALKGLDRIYNRQGKFTELLETLDRQIAAAATPRQKVTLFERIAALHDEEFLDHAKAAEALEEVLALDSNNDAALTGLARHYRRLDRWEKVIGVYDRHLAVLGDEPRSTDLLVAKARTLADQVGSPERAMKAFEQVLSRDPQHAGALEALAHLREVTGDAHAALSAIEALAAKAESPPAKADQWMRAGRLLEARGDKDGAIERFKLALDANPKDVNAAVALRKAYYERGETQAIQGLIERELAGAESELAKARLHAELAKLYKSALKDDLKAEASAKRAVDLDGTNAEALLVLGDLAFDAGRFIEATRWYEGLVHRPQVLENGAGTAMLVRFVEAYGKSQPKVEAAPMSMSIFSMPSISESAPPPSLAPPTATNPKLAVALKALREFAPTDIDAITRIATVLFDHGDPELVHEIYAELFAKHSDKLKGSERVDALYHLGESARRSERLDDAEKPLVEAAELDPKNARVLRALGKLYDELGKLEPAHDARKKRVEAVDGAEKFEALLDLADFQFTRLADAELAKKTYARALQEKPADRRLLTKLMQLYSEGKDWAKLVDVIEKLADGVDDKKQRAKYMHTAASLSNVQLEDKKRAAGYYEKVLELDGTNSRAADEFVTLCMETKAHETAERVLNDQLDLAQESADRERIRKLLDQVGDLYLKFLNEPAMAIDAFEAAQAFDPDDAPRAEKLAELYASDPAQYLDKAVKSQGKLLEANPYRVESYKLLRRLYTEAKQADPAWCLCQALGVLNLAEPEEERFYKKHKAESAAAAQAVVADDDWARLTHPDADPLVTRVFTLVQPTILRTRNQSLAEMGYDQSHMVDTAASAYPLAQTLYYASGVLAVAPPVLENTNDPGGLGFLHATEPAILFGAAAATIEATTQQLAYLTGRHLTYYRPGFYVQKLVPTGTGLKAWLFAAIKLCVPNFPVAVDIQAQVEEAVTALQKDMAPAQKDQLASTVSKILKEGTALDLKRWVAGIDLSADRAGFLLAHDLETASECIRATEADSPVTTKERLKELVLFGIGEDYFALRRKLAITIEG